MDERRDVDDARPAAVGPERLAAEQRARVLIDAQLTAAGWQVQSAMHATGLPEEHRRRARVHDGRLPFVLEASGSETIVMRVGSSV